MEGRNGPQEGGGMDRAGDQRLAASFSRRVCQSSGRLPPRTRCSTRISRCPGGGFARFHRARFGPWSPVGTQQRPCVSRRAC